MVRAVALVAQDRMTRSLSTFPRSSPKRRPRDEEERVMVITEFDAGDSEATMHALADEILKHRRPISPNAGVEFCDNHHAVAPIFFIALSGEFWRGSVGGPVFVAGSSPWQIPPVCKRLSATSASMCGL